MKTLTAYRTVTTRALAMYEQGGHALTWDDRSYQDRNHTVKSEPVTIYVQDGYSLRPNTYDETMLFPDAGGDGMTVGEAITARIARVK